ncbi:MAG: holin [Candidatus Odinarchaeota archaeon]
MKRFKNYALWLAILGFIPMLADSLGVYDINVILPGNYDNLVKALLGILVLAGILNNPTTENKGYSDD